MEYDDAKERISMHHKKAYVAESLMMVQSLTLMIEGTPPSLPFLI
jgi:hypothetical protein